MVQFLKYFFLVFFMDELKLLELRYRNKVKNWSKLAQDLELLMNSDRSDKRLLLHRVVRLAVSKGLDYLYVGSDSVCKEFREELFKVKRSEYMSKVLSVLS